MVDVKSLERFLNQLVFALDDVVLGHCGLGEPAAEASVDKGLDLREHPSPGEASPHYRLESVNKAKQGPAKRCWHPESPRASRRRVSVGVLEHVQDSFLQLIL